MEFGESDHRPLVTYISDQKEERRGQFQFDSRLLQREGFKDIVARAWNQLRLLEDEQNLPTKIIHCRKAISIWERKNISNSEERIKILRPQLDNAIATGSVPINEIAKMRRELNQAYAEEEMYWKIKSRNTWLMTGDRNTKYFHSTAKKRRVRNRVISIQDNNGVIRKGDQNIAAVAQDYFQGLFTSSPASSTCYEEIFQGFQSRVTKDMNVDLTKEVSIEEIREATFSIGPSKAPGPDGFTGDFYQQF